MFNKYFELIKSLFNAVFVSGGESVRFVDYLYVLGFTFALIACAALFIAFCIVLVKAPFWGYNKFIQKTQDKLTQITTAISDQNFEVFSKKTIYEEYSAVFKSLKVKRICYVLGVVFIYIPFIIPTVLFIVSWIKSLL